jgi:hypothetical protein
MTRMEMSLTNEIIADLESVDRGPCLSLYQETHRTSPDNIQDPIRFRNLVKLLKSSFQEKYPELNLQDFIEPFDSLEKDFNFWDHNMDGLAVLVGDGQFHVFRLQRPVSELAVTENVFFLGPLRRYLQSVDRFQILGLGLNEIKLFEGNRNSLDAIVPAPGVPNTMTAALGEDLSEIEKSVSSHSGIGPGTTPSHHGHSDKQNEIDIDTEKFFRAVDSAVLKYHSRPSALPLILACLPEHQHLFHQISSNPFLLDEGLGINPEALSLNELKERAWKFIEPDYLKKLTMLSEEFLEAEAKGQGSDDIAQITKATANGKVATLLLDADRLDEAGRGKAIEDLSEMVGKMGGIVQIIPSEQMPGRTGLAASYRY